MDRTSMTDFVCRECGARTPLEGNERGAPTGHCKKCMERAFPVAQPVFCHYSCNKEGALRICE